MVWARRFAGYKRADLLLEDQERFRRLMENEKYPIQIIWAGKALSIWIIRQFRLSIVW